MERCLAGWERIWGEMECMSLYCRSDYIALTPPGLMFSNRKRNCHQYICTLKGSPDQECHQPSSLKAGQVIRTYSMGLPGMLAWRMTHRIRGLFTIQPAKRCLSRNITREQSNRQEGLPRELSEWQKIRRGIFPYLKTRIMRSSQCRTKGRRIWRRLSRLGSQMGYHGRSIIEILGRRTTSKMV